MPYFSGIIRGLREGSGTERTGPVAILKIKCVWVKACALPSQAASLEYLVALDEYSQALLTELR